MSISNGSFQTVLRLKGHIRIVSALDSDLEYVLSGSVDKTVRLWSVSKDEGVWFHKQICVLRGHFIKVCIITQKILCKDYTSRLVMLKSPILMAFLLVGMELLESGI